MSYLSKEKIEDGLSELYKLEEFTPKDYDGFKKIEAEVIHSIFGYYDYLKISDTLSCFPYSTSYDLMKVIEYYEKSFTEAMSDKEIEAKTSVVDTSGWKAEDVYKDN